MDTKIDPNIQHCYRNNETDSAVSADLGLVDFYGVI